MLKNFLAGFLCVTLSAALLGAEPEKVVAVKAPGIPGGEAKFPPRDQLRAGLGTKRIALNKQMRAALNSQTIPVPSTWDWTKGNTISFPMLGNDKWGDCYYVAACKIFIAANANATGTKVVFDESKVVARYRTLSGGDNGLSDDQILPEMLKGVIGPNGPHKILDRAVVSSTDHTALGLCQYAFGPTLFTFAVPEAIMQQVRPGVLWDTQKGDLQTGDGYVGGHAVILTGKNTKANYSLQTWGLNPPVEVTPRFMANNDPECITVFTLEWFDAKGYAPNGFHYETLAPLWTQITGGKLPASPFPPPVTPQPPVPPAPPVPPVPPLATGFDVVVNGDTIRIDPLGKSVTLPAGWKGGKGVGVGEELTAAGVSPAVIVDVTQLLLDLKSKAGASAILVDILKLFADATNTTPMSTAPVPVVYPRQRFTATDGTVYEMYSDGYYRAIANVK